MVKKIDKKLYVILLACVSILIIAAIFVQYSNVCLTQSCKIERIESMRSEIQNKWKTGKSEFSDLNNLVKNVSEEFNKSTEKKFDAEISKLSGREKAIDFECNRLWAERESYMAYTDCQSGSSSELEDITKKIKSYQSDKGKFISKSDELLKMSANSLENIKLLNPETSVSDADLILSNFQKIEKSLSLFVASDDAKSALDTAYIEDKIKVKNSISSRFNENIKGIIEIHKIILQNS